MSRTEDVGERVGARRAARTKVAAEAAQRRSDIVVEPPSRRARLTAAAVVLLCVAGGAGLAALLLGSDGERYTAEFTSARGLVAGNDVRIDGALAGRVEAVELTRDGHARVAYTLKEQATRPKADAAAAIRPVDLLGDTYLALSPGTRGTLRGPIPVARTSNAPRLDELLRTFQPGVRDGVRALLVEGGLALDRRGDDLARATIALRPALRAADGVLGELDAQDAALARLVPRAEHAASQVAERAQDVGPLLDGLAGTLRTTATRGKELDAGIARAPATLARLRSTSDELAATARTATPVAAQVRDLAPALTTAVADLGPLLERTRTAAPQLTALLGTGRSFLTGGSDGFGALTQGLRDATTAAPDTTKLLDALVPAAPKIAEGFLVNFPDQAAEPGRQPFDPFADPRRAYWRGAAVFSCEAFGVPVAPGCLGKVLAADKTKAKAKRGVAPRPAAPAAGAPAPAPAPAAAPAAKPKATEVVPKVLDDLTKPSSDPSQPLKPATDAAGDLLDFLLAP